ncbi:TBC1 domain, member 5 [Geranomyces michiganensis]|nr:TBC1 domain, member 5 [Geranomyces michiganensis]
MRSPGDLIAGWRTVLDDPLLSLDRLKVRGLAGELDSNSLRSLYWKIYLEYLPLSSDAWPLLLAKERQGYADLKKKFMSDPNETAKKSNDYTLNNPLSTAEESPWTQYFRDTELQKTIRQDVERTFPDEPAFRVAATQDLMTAILFIWCKLNPDVSYRQGMHELLAPILLVVQTDALDTEAAGAAELNPTIIATFDPLYIEHDAAVLFYRLMRPAKTWFELGTDATPSKGQARFAGHRRLTEPNTPQVPIVSVCRRVQNDLLRVLDPPLHAHLEKQGIEPQLYGLRWFRLLFGREFALHDLLLLWDGIFAEDANLGLVEWVCVALLKHMRGGLVGADYTATMHGLMKSSRLNAAVVIELLESARELREQYTQRALKTNSEPSFENVSVDGLGSVGYSEKVRKKRTTVPWVQHTPTTTTGPLNPPSPDGMDATTAKSPATSPIPPQILSPDEVRVLQHQVTQLTRSLKGAEERERVALKRIKVAIHRLVEYNAANGNETLQNVIAELKETASGLMVHSDEPKFHRPPPVEISQSSQPPLFDKQLVGACQKESAPPTPSYEPEVRVTHAAAEVPESSSSTLSHLPAPPPVASLSTPLADNAIDNPKTNSSASKVPPPIRQWGSSAEIRYGPAPAQGNSTGTAGRRATGATAAGMTPSFAPLRGQWGSSEEIRGASPDPLGAGARGVPRRPPGILRRDGEPVAGENHPI